MLRSSSVCTCASVRLCVCCFADAQPQNTFCASSDKRSIYHTTVKVHGETIHTQPHPQNCCFDSRGRRREARQC
eukprot:1187918-Rhodomonas_salina.1